MAIKEKVVIRYSEAFQKKVAEEIMKGRHSMESARKFYDINGRATIKGWLKKWGGDKYLPKRVVIQMPDEIDEKKKLKAEIKKLREALARESLKNHLLESMIEIAGDKFGVDIKKKFGESQ